MNYIPCLLRKQWAVNAVMPLNCGLFKISNPEQRYLICNLSFCFIFSTLMSSRRLSVNAHDSEVEERDEAMNTKHSNGVVKR